MSIPVTWQPQLESGHQIDPANIELVDTQPIDISYLIAGSISDRENPSASGQ
jgi:hypothetical protein